MQTPQRRSTDRYNDNEIDLMFDASKKRDADIDRKLDLILVQTTKHNGRLTRLERVVLVVACVTATLLITKFPEILQIFKLFT